MTATLRKLTPEERFWSKVDKTDTCWLWTASLGAEGYGRIAWNKKSKAVHRLSYELLVGPIPEGLQIDHLCRVRNCLNPDHLEPVTPRENTMRSTSWAAKYAARDHCLYGHPFDEANTHRRRSGHRVCRECSRIRTRESMGRLRARRRAND